MSMYCGKSEDIDHLFLSCDFFRKIWYDIFIWFGFTMFADHLFQFGNLGSFLKNYMHFSSFNLIFMCVGHSAYI